MLCFWENCGSTFKDPNAFHLHLKEHGEQSINYKCKWKACHVKRESKIGLISHLDVHVSIALFACDHCNEKFKRPHDLKRHIHASRCKVLKKLNQESSPISPSQKISIDSPLLADTVPMQTKRPLRSITNKRIKSNPIKRKRNINKQTNTAAQTMLQFKHHTTTPFSDAYHPTTSPTRNHSNVSLIESLIHQELLKLQHNK